ncbi:YcaO-like family protein [Cryptosporangium aurantiacum]|uniref:Ribosomal protein S12 methylthiotransferase accessory factor n=1 Tax=Cryptosporangium aurantiacum TaxID=134849 RepID=A0A1M7RGV7_9ACTN|nr:YcaO-like family protein [Cryptosporangium aurantiacum]SHN45402.1 ribosomal protein S12 methylthiotransferase accessory factor [Cryptosporangium aurantiacum]
MTASRTADDPADLARRLAYLLDPKVGVIRAISEVPRSPGAPEFFQYSGRASDTAAFTGQRNFANTGGASTEPLRAAGKAMGEAVERYCAAIYDLDDFPVVARSAADFDCVPPADFALYTPAQYGEPGFQMVPFTDESPVRWTAAYNAVTRQTQHVPTASVYVPYYYAPGEAPVIEPISTGLSCGRSVLEASVSAVCEVVERDAFVLTWQAMMRPARIRPASLDPVSADLVDRFDRVGLEAIVFDVTTDLGIPTVMTVLRSSSPERPALAFAAATAMTAAEAVRKGLEELEHTRRYCQQIFDYAPRLEVVEGHENVVSQVEHLNFWCDHANAPLASFLFEDVREIDLDEISAPPPHDPADQLRWVVDRIADTGYHTLLVDLTTDDVAVAGLYVVRAVVPGLHPLCMGHRYRALGGTRLWTVPQKLGHRGITDHDNPSPHPFP